MGVASSCSSAPDIVQMPYKITENVLNKVIRVSILFSNSMEASKLNKHAYKLQPVVC